MSRPQNSLTFHFNLTEKQFEKRYEGQVFLTVVFNHLTLVLTKRCGGLRVPNEGKGGVPY